MLDRWQKFFHETRSFIETGVGGLLFSLPFWHHLMIEISEISQFIAGVCGAVIGLHGVYRIFRRYNPEAQK